jgi:hypothetical protein
VYITKAGKNSVTGGIENTEVVAAKKRSGTGAEGGVQGGFVKFRLHLLYLLS